MIAAISTGTRRSEAQHRLDSMAGLAFDEAVALLARTEPNRPYSHALSLELLGRLGGDDSAALAEALASFIAD